MKIYYILVVTIRPYNWIVCTTIVYMVVVKPSLDHYLLPVFPRSTKIYRGCVSRHIQEASEISVFPSVSLLKHEIVSVNSHDCKLISMINYYMTSLLDLIWIIDNWLLLYKTMQNYHVCMTIDMHTQIRRLTHLYRLKIRSTLRSTPKSSRTLKLPLDLLMFASTFMLSFIQLVFIGFSFILLL